MNTENQKQERTEYISMKVTKDVKAEFDIARDNKTLQETIVRNFIKSEECWLTDEMKRIDEITIKYKAKLIGIKDNFGKAQDIYCAEIESLFTKVNDADKKIAEKLRTSQALIENMSRTVNEINQKVPYVNVERIERLLSVAENFAEMSSEEKRLIELIITAK